MAKKSKLVLNGDDVCTLIAVCAKLDHSKYVDKGTQALLLRCQDAVEKARNGNPYTVWVQQ